MWDGYAVRRHDPTFSHTLNTQPMEEDLYIRKYRVGMYGVHRHDPTFPPYFKYTAHGEKCIHKKCGMGMLFADTTQLSPIL